MSELIIKKARPCQICGKILNVGEPFVFEIFRYHKVDRSLPCHKSCVIDDKTKAQITQLKAEAATNGHSFEGGLDIMTDSLIDELKAEIERGKQWGYTFVTHDRLQSLIRKYSVSTPGDISEQPGEWEVRGGYVDALQHDGSIAGATTVINWVVARGGRIHRYGSDPAKDEEFLKLDSPRTPNIMGRGWWVVKTEDDIFYTLPDADFHTLYVPRKTDG